MHLISDFFHAQWRAVVFAIPILATLLVLAARRRR